MKTPEWYRESDFCNICGGDKPHDDDSVSYMINPPGGYDLPETWACRACILSGEVAEDKVERIRERYPEDFE